MTSRSFVLASAIALSAIASNAVAQQLPDRLKDLQDARASVRIRAFYRLLSQHEVVPSRLDARQGTRALLAANPAAGRTIGGALIRLLERENHEWKIAGIGSMSEDRSDFYGDLVASVSVLEDARGIPALIGAIGTGNNATDGLAALGENVIPAVTRVLESGDVTERIGAITVLGKLSRRGIPASAAPVIRTGLVRSLDDSNPWVRLSAIEYLPSSSDESIVRAVTRIAVADSSVRARTAATAWLETRKRSR